MVLSLFRGSTSFGFAVFFFSTRVPKHECKLQFTPRGISIYISQTRFVDAFYYVDYAKRIYNLLLTRVVSTALLRLAWATSLFSCSAKTIPR